MQHCSLTDAAAATVVVVVVVVVVDGVVAILSY